jgi:hypothetical protein
LAFCETTRPRFVASRDERREIFANYWHAFAIRIAIFKCRNTLETVPKRYAGYFRPNLSNYDFLLHRSHLARSREQARVAEIARMYFVRVMQ